MATPPRPQPAPPPPPPPPSRAQERDVFLAALDQGSPTEQAAFLDQACRGNPALRQAVEELLACHRPDTFLETPVAAAPPPSGSPPAPRPAPNLLPILTGPGPGDTLGRYKLLEQIGEGGAGTVFMAEQTEPVRRRVALKLIKAGMDTKAVIARFETERQALALMDHPNIARVLDAGSTDTGRPFFVMELVRGDRITTYCDAAQLTTRERLGLFIQVCHAIQHAHQKGIIHRDIKPSNILVTHHDGVPVPKVIDFGISKAIDHRLTEATFFTEFHAFIGTPAYMSPEQAERSGLDIDTRTDVYSLGVLLYEILTGRTPFDARELLAAGVDGMRQTIREREPLAPSTRLRSLPVADRTTTAQRQQLEPARLASVLRGDLDWIVLKALEKDRTRRYETANSLALDVERYLANEPIAARPPSTWYRLQKLARRHRFAVAAAATATATLAVGLSLASWQYLEKSATLRRAQAAEQRERNLRETAQSAQARELSLRQQAETQERRARERAYAADINLAQHALAAHNLGRARELLERQRPVPDRAPQAPDLRGWEWRHLWFQCRSDALFALPRQSNEIASLTISADSRWLAAGDSGGHLSLFDLRSRQEVARLDTGSARVRTTFSPTAPLLAFNAADPVRNPGAPGWARSQRIRLWDPQRQRVLWEIPLGGACLGLGFSADGTHLAALSSDRQLTLRQVADGAEVHRQELPGLRWLQTAVALSSDLTLVAYGVEGGRLRVVDVATGRARWTAVAAEEDIKSLAFSPDGTRLASGGGFAESTIRLWDTATGTETERLVGHRAWITSLSFWPDGATLASTSADQTIRLWDVGGPLPPPRLAADDSSPPRERSTLRGHALEVWSLALAPDRGTLVSGSKDGSIFVWDAFSPYHRERGHLTVPTTVEAWCFSPDSRSLLTLDAQGSLVRWAGPSFQEGASELDVDLELRPGPALFSPDARYLVASHPRRGLQLWDIPRRQLVPLPPSTGRPESLWPVGFLPDSSHLVIRRFRDQVLEAWDLATASRVQSWRHELGHGDPGLTALSPDGRWSLAANRNGQGSLLDRLTGQEFPLQLPHGQTGDLAFSPDGTRFGSASGQGIGSLWQTAPLRQIGLIQGFLQGLSSIAFSPDGARVVVGSDGREALKVWDAANSQELITLGAEGSGFGHTAFSPDGNLLGARNSRGTLHVWRAPDFAEIAGAEAATTPP